MDGWGGASVNGGRPRAQVPAPAFNLHELLASTAFAVAADCLFGVEDEVIDAWSVPLRWALGIADAVRAPSPPLQR